MTLGIRQIKVITSCGTTTSTITTNYPISAMVHGHPDKCN